MNWENLFYYVLLFSIIGVNNFRIFTFAEDGQDKASEDAPENNPQYTTVYVGNLAPEVGFDYLW